MKKYSILLINSFLVILSSCYSNNIVSKQTTSPNNEVQKKVTQKIEVNKEYFSIKEKVLNLKVNEIFDLKEIITCSDSSIKENIKYLVLDPQKINIQGSKITAIKDGNTNIEFKYNAQKIVLNVNINTIIPVPSLTPSPSSTISSEDYSEADIKRRFTTISGVTLDYKGNPVEDVNIIAEEDIFRQEQWKAQTISDSNGKIVFNHFLVETRVSITAKKEGWTTRSIRYIAHDHFSEGNYGSIDFLDYDALQDEPEVSEIKINNILFTQGDRTQERPSEKSQSNLTVKNPNLTFNIKFSEPINKKILEDNFFIFSPEFSKDGVDKFNMDMSNKNNLFTFKWSENRDSVSIKVNKPLLVNKENNIPFKYRVKIPQNALLDNTEKNALDVDFKLHTGVIRFASKVAYDSVIFSVENDLESPKLLDMKLLKNSNGEPLVELYFNEPLETLGFKTPLANLNYNNQSFKSSDGEIMILSTDNKNVYALAQVELNKDYVDNDKFPYKNVGINGELTNIEVNENKITLSFSKNTFIKGNILVLSIGKLPIIPSIEFKEVEFEQLEDLAGNKINSNLKTRLKGINIYENQRFTKIVD
jgi:hypothetical protein